MKEKQEWRFAEPWLMVVRFCVALTFLYTIVAFMRSWPYPLKAVFALLRSSVRIDAPGWLCLVVPPFLLFSVVFHLLAMFSLFMGQSRFTRIVGRIGQVYWAADTVLCICHCLGGKAVPGVTVCEIALDVLCICLVSATIRLRQKKAGEDARQEQTEAEKAEAAAWEKKRSKIVMIVFTVLISIQLTGALFLYVMFCRDGDLCGDPKNSIISGRYKGWHRVQLNEEHLFFLPDDWMLAEDGGLLYIEDGTGRTVAFGKRFEHDPTTEEYDAFLSERLEKTVLGSEITDSQSLYGYNYAWYDETYFFEDGQEKKMLVIHFDFYSDDRCYYLLFDQPDEELHTTASAIIYSIDK